MGPDRLALLNLLIVTRDRLPLHLLIVSLHCKRCSATLRRFVRSGRLFGCPEPRHQFVDAFLRPAVHQSCQQVSEICLRIDAVQLAGFD